MHALPKPAAAIAALVVVLASCGRSAGDGDPGEPGGPTACQPLACESTDACGVLVDGCGGTVKCPCPESKLSRCDPPSTEFCSDDGFCWLNPLPQGDDLRGVWGAGDDAVWAAGPAGAMLLWDGSRWLRVALPRGGFANAVWGTAEDDAWAVGSGVFRWDGRCWTDVGAPVPEGGLAQVHGTGPDDVWASGPNGLVHFDGTSWSPVAAPPGPPPSALLALARDRVLVGTRAAIWTWDGARWTEAFLGWDIRDVVQLWAAAPDDVWAAVALEPERCRGTGCATAWQAMFHFDGAAWSRAGPAVARPDFHAVTGSSASDVWAFTEAEAWHWDGAGWTSRPLPRRPGSSSWPTAVRAARQGDVGWAVGDAGLILRRDGGTWSLAGGFGALGAFGVATGTSEHDAWFGPKALGTYGGETVDLLHWDGRSLTPVPTGLDDVIYSAWAAGPGELWAGTFGSGLLHLHDGTWSAGALHTDAVVRDVLGFGPQDVYWIEWFWPGSTSGAGRLRRWDGNTVVSYGLSPGGWKRVAGTSGSDLWLVGGGCSGCELSEVLHVARFDGARWSYHVIPGENRYPQDVWSDGGGSAWIVGGLGLVARAGPEGVSPLPSFGTDTLEVVVGGGPSDVWAFGWHGAALHFDGRTWAARSSGTRQWLLAAWRSPAGELFVSGMGGAILRRAPGP